MFGPRSGRWSTEERQTYTFVDQRPLRGPNYYRLQQIDYDGTFDYSPIETATFAAAGKVTMYPTATRDVLTIVAPADDSPATIRVFNLNGALVQQRQVGAAAQWELRLGELPAGTYLVSVQTGARTYQERVVKL